MAVSLEHSDMILASDGMMEMNSLTLGYGMDPWIIEIDNRSSTAAPLEKHNMTSAFNTFSGITRLSSLTNPWVSQLIHPNSEMLTAAPLEYRDMASAFSVFERVMEYSWIIHPANAIMTFPSEHHDMTAFDGITEMNGLNAMDPWMIDLKNRAPMAAPQDQYNMVSAFNTFNGITRTSGLTDPWVIQLTHPNNEMLTEEYRDMATPFNACERMMDNSWTSYPVHAIYVPLPLDYQDVSALDGIMEENGLTSSNGMNLWMIDLGSPDAYNCDYLQPQPPPQLQTETDICNVLRLKSDAHRSQSTQRQPPLRHKTKTQLQSSQRKATSKVLDLQLDVHKRVSIAPQPESQHQTEKWPCSPQQIAAYQANHYQLNARRCESNEPQPQIQFQSRSELESQPQSSEQVANSEVLHLKPDFHKGESMEHQSESLPQTEKQRPNQPSSLQQTPASQVNHYQLNAHRCESNEPQSQIQSQSRSESESQPQSSEQMASSKVIKLEPSVHEHESMEPQPESRHQTEKQRPDQPSSPQQIAASQVNHFELNAHRCASNKPQSQIQSQSRSESESRPQSSEQMATSKVIILESDVHKGESMEPQPESRAQKEKLYFPPRQIAAPQAIPLQLNILRRESNELQKHSQIQSKTNLQNQSSQRRTISESFQHQFSNNSRTRDRASNIGHDEVSVNPEELLLSESASGNNEPLSTRLFVGGLSWWTTPCKLRQYFQLFGTVTNVRLMRCPITQRSRGFGFITFADPQTIEKVLKVQSHILDDKNIKPERATPKNGPKITNRRKIFVGGVSQATSKEEVESYFSQFGKVEETQLAVDQHTKRHRGFGFVTFENEAVADSVTETHFCTIKNKKVECNKPRPKGIVQKYLLGKLISVNPMDERIFNPAASRCSGKSAAARSVAATYNNSHGSYSTLTCYRNAPHLHSASTPPVHQAPVVLTTYAARHRNSPHPVTVLPAAPTQTVQRVQTSVAVVHTPAYTTYFEDDNLMNAHLTSFQRAAWNAFYNMRRHV